MSNQTAPALGETPLSEIQDAELLARLLASDRLSAAERAEAGDKLASLSDPRFRADRFFLPDEPLLGFVHIPSGPFRMGEAAQIVETPDFYIARYPTIVAQYKAFIEDSGFEPGNPACVADPANRPVAWVNWFEALAYCDWLSEKLAAHAREILASVEGKDNAAFWTGLAEGQLRVTLPAEHEWEKAARGDQASAFPWGEDINPQRANYKESGIARTTAVGAFPAGASPYGVLDMSGNVWNWQRTQWGPSLEEPAYTLPYDADDGRNALDGPADFLRGMRGGSFLVEEKRARSTYRDAVNPADRDDGDGFRVVIVSASELAAKP